MELKTAMITIKPTYFSRLFTIFLLSALYFLLSVGAHAAWVDAPAGPPGYNTNSGCLPKPCAEADFKPVNLSLTPQTKAGPLTVGSLCFGVDCRSTWSSVAGTNYWSLSGSNLSPLDTNHNVLVPVARKLIVRDLTGGAGSQQTETIGFNNGNLFVHHENVAQPVGVTSIVNLAGNRAGVGSSILSINQAGSGPAALFFGNVGIGTASPGYKLDVAGAVNGSTGVYDTGVRVCRSDGINCQAGAAPAWSSITGRPLGLDDGDDVGVTSIIAGTGLTGGTITTSGTIAADTSYLQRRVTGTCAAGSSISAIDATGAVTCEPDDVGVAGTNYWSLSGSNLSPLDTNHNVLVSVGAGKKLIQRDAASGAGSQQVETIGFNNGRLYVHHDGPSGVQPVGVTSLVNFAGNRISESILSVNQAGNGPAALFFGNVGIGTANPGTYKLNVAGSAYFSGGLAVPSGQDITINGISVCLEDNTNCPVGLAPAWSSITGKPAGFSDDIDNDTTYSVGTGLSLSGTTFSLNTANANTWTGAQTFNNAYTYVNGILSAAGHVTLGDSSTDLINIYGTTQINRDLFITTPVNYGTQAGNGTIYSGVKKHIVEAPPSDAGWVVPIDNTIMDSLCRDIDGCTFTYGMINWDAGGQPGSVTSRTARFFISETSRWWRFDNDISAQDNNGGTDEWGSWDCIFTDAETAIGTSNQRVDAGPGFGLLNVWGGGYSDTTTTCRVIIED